jgi:hypothetical protein
VHGVDHRSCDRLDGVGACGGDDEAAADGDAAVGACIDAGDQAVQCDSPEAVMELVSDLDAPDAIACIVIDDPPQEEVEVGDGSFCAEPLDNP